MVNEKKSEREGGRDAEGGRGQHLRQWRENWFTLDRLVITEGKKMTWIEQWECVHGCVFVRACVCLED